MRKIFLFSLLCMQFLSARADTLDSLFHLFENSGGTQQAATARILVRQLCEQEYFDYAVADPLPNNRKFTHMLVHLGMSIHAYENDNFPEAIALASKAIELADKDSLHWLCSGYELLNVSYQRTGDYPNALAYAQKAYDAGTQLHDESIRSNALNSLAAIHCSTGHLDDALDYIDQAIAIERLNKTGEGKSLAVRLGSKCEILNLLHRYDEALACINEAISIDSSAGRSNKVGIRLSQKAVILISLQKWTTARDICLKALPIFEQNGNSIDKIITLRQLGECEMHLNQTNDAEEHLIEAESLCLKVGSRPLLWKIQYDLSQLYRSKGDFKQSISFLEKSFANRDSLNKEEFDKIIGDYKVKYETAQKEQQLQLQQITIRNRTMLAVILTILFLLAGITVVIVFRLASIRKKRNAELAALNKTKDQLFSIVSHDLRNPVAAQKQVIDYMATHYDQISEHDKREQLEALKESQDSLTALVSNLLDWASVASGHLPYRPTRANLATLVEKCVRMASPQSLQKGIRIQTDVPDESFVSTDVNFTETILRNLLSNAIKFSPHNSQIEIHTDNSADTVMLSITDHGIGMTKEQADNLFSQVKSTTGTSGEKGIGLGLTVCKKLIEKGPEELTFTSEPGQGSTFRLILKKAK